MPPRFQPKVNELSAREDFIINSFPDMKKINTICSKLFELYYIDIDRKAELSPLMRTMVPSYYVDPGCPEHPGTYIMAGKSNISYLERIVFVSPFVNAKGKYEYELSGWKGLLMRPLQFHEGVKSFRKSLLEPIVIIGERNNEKCAKNLVLREGDTPSRDELIIPFLQLPHRIKDGDDAYEQALDQLIYQPFYRYMMHYLDSSPEFTIIPSATIKEMLEEDITEIITPEGDSLTVTKSLFPTAKEDQMFYVSKIDEPMIDTSGGKFHYLIKQDYVSDQGVPYITIYTLMAALQLSETLQAALRS